MEALIQEILPDVYDWFTDYAVDMLLYLGPGVLISFLLWTVAFAVDSVFSWLKRWTAS